MGAGGRDSDRLLSLPLLAPFELRYHLSAKLTCIGFSVMSNLSLTSETAHFRASISCVYFLKQTSKICDCKGLKVSVGHNSL